MKKVCFLVMCTSVLFMNESSAKWCIGRSPSECTTEEKRNKYVMDGCLSPDKCNSVFSNTKEKEKDKDKDKNEAAARRLSKEAEKALRPARMFLMQKTGIINGNSTYYKETISQLKELVRLVEKVN